MHLERLEQQVRLVPHALAQTLEFRPVQVVSQDGRVVGVRALLDDDARTLAGRKAADVSEALFHG